jgi:pimeloyl-ACP methyl ester carboxylesterase
MRYVFLPGGPGFGGMAEETLLRPYFERTGHTLTIWTEPSTLRAGAEPFVREGACARWLASAERCLLDATTDEPAHLIAHSVSALAALHLTRRHPVRVTSVVLVAPSTDLFSTFVNVLRLAHEDLAGTNPAVAAGLARCLAGTTQFFDAPMREGLELVLHDDRLFTHYWADPVQMQASLAARAQPGGQFDVESFFAVLGDLAVHSRTLLAEGPVSASTLALFGPLDRVTPFDEQERPLRVAVPQAQVEPVAGCSHYVHLDRPDWFIGRLARWSRSLEAGRSRAP